MTSANFGPDADLSLLSPMRGAADTTITITALSVAVIIGAIELIGLLADKAGITTGPLASIATIDLNYVGYGIVGLFFATWVVALTVWRFGKIEQRWTAHVRPAQTD